MADPARLAIVDRLAISDASPGELGRLLGQPTNLVAHHLGVLDSAGLIVRTRSEGDRRRSYVQLRADEETVRAVTRSRTAAPGISASMKQVLFICTANSARSQLAAATWNSVSPIPAG